MFPAFFDISVKVSRTDPIELDAALSSFRDRNPVVLSETPVHRLCARRAMQLCPPLRKEGWQPIRLPKSAQSVLLPTYCTPKHFDRPVALPPTPVIHDYVQLFDRQFVEHLRLSKDAA